MDRLSAAVREKRYEDAAQIVYKVKSSTGSIGVKVRYNFAISLQRALDEETEDEILPLQEEFSDGLTKLVEEISEFLG